MTPQRDASTGAFASLPRGTATATMRSLFRPAGRLRTLALGLVVTLAAVRSGARADDPLPTTDDDPPAKAAPQSGPRGESRPAVTDKAPVSPDDEKLLENLGTAGKSIESEIEKLERAISGMRQAGEKIESDDTGAKTLEVQKQVIKDLEDLLKFMKQQQQQNRQQRERQRMPQQKLDPQNAGQTPGQQRQQPGERTDAERSREANERAEAARRALAEEARRQQMFKDVWGHLPPHLRDAMMNSFNEKYLPKYEDLVKRYYQALAEKRQNRPAK